MISPFHHYIQDIQFIHIYVYIYNYIYTWNIIPLYHVQSPFDPFMYPLFSACASCPAQGDPNSSGRTSGRKWGMVVVTSEVGLGQPATPKKSKKWVCSGNSILESTFLKRCWEKVGVLSFCWKIKLQCSAYETISPTPHPRSANGVIGGPTWVTLSTTDNATHDPWRTTNEKWKKENEQKMSCWCFPLFLFYSASGPLGLCFTSGPEPRSQQPSPHRHGSVLAHKPSANHGETWIGSTE